MQSTVDAAAVSATVSGLILSAASFIVYVSAWLQFPLTNNDVGVLASGLGMAAGLIWAIFGAIRKFLVRYSA